MKLSFKEALAAVVLISIMAMIAAGGIFGIQYAEVALGALLVWGGNIVQYYWRKSEPKP